MFAVVGMGASMAYLLAFGRDLSGYRNLPQVKQREREREGGKAERERERGREREGERVCVYVCVCGKFYWCEFSRGVGDGLVLSVNMYHGLLRHALRVFAVHLFTSAVTPRRLRF